MGTKTITTCFTITTYYNFRFKSSSLHLCTPQGHRLWLYGDCWSTRNRPRQIDRNAIMALSLSSHEEDALYRVVDSHDSFYIPTGVAIDELFEIDRSLKWIEEKCLSRVTLQFPDSLLSYAPKVAEKLRRRSSMSFAVLGDTSYGECCVDEVAAEHFGSDGVIHYGNSCLTPTQRLPVLHIFTSLPIDISDLLEKLDSIDDSRQIYLFYDVRFHTAIEAQRHAIGSSQRVYICAVPKEPTFHSKCGRVCNEEITSNDVILYCGHSTKYVLILALTFPQCHHYNYNPGEKKLNTTISNISRTLMQRFYLIERVKDASRIGILVGTLGVSRYRDIIDKIITSIKVSGKRPYTFLVGKPNVAKLANFPEIDAFVLVACPENSVVGSKEFMQPVITPFELDVALNRDRDWATGEFHADFQDLLPEGKSFKEFYGYGADVTDVSLITGRLRTTGLGVDAENKAVVTQKTTLAVLHTEGGGQYLAERSWQGLEQKLGETPLQKADKGRMGTAMGYEGEA